MGPVRAAAKGSPFCGFRSSGTSTLAGGRKSGAQRAEAALDRALDGVSLRDLGGALEVRRQGYALGEKPMAHVIEAAPSGRAKCRGCGQAVAAKELRFGEKRSNPFGEGEATNWFHVECGAYKRPEPFLETLATTTEAIGDRERLKAEAKLGVVHERVTRANGAERSPSGRAACRHCRNNIDKGAWRISLTFYEEGMFQPAGFLHVRCAAEYFGTSEVLPRIARFSPALGDGDLREIAKELQR